MDAVAVGFGSTGRGLVVGGGVDALVVGGGDGGLTVGGCDGGLVVGGVGINAASN